jgi:alkanesulfonate monooxygenase SsuD/methylene tetrahydromethanopterin reductase-like flavin-dependent oxidoreductase (luciferase family)
MAPPRATERAPGKGVASRRWEWVEMRFSMFLNNRVRNPNREQYHETFEQLELAEELGFSGVWFGEHHFTDFGRPATAVMAAQALARTERLTVGSAVVILPMHHPLQVAEDWATLDQVSRGRVQFGFGRGVGLDFAPMGASLPESLPRMMEAYEIIRRAWTEETFSYNGQFWKIPTVSVFPRPYQKPHPPLWQPAVSPTTIDWLVQQGINGQIGSMLTPLKTLVEEYWNRWHAAKAAFGRPELEFAHSPLVFVGESEREVRRIVEQPLHRWVNYISESLGLLARGIPNKWGDRIASLPYEEIFQELTICGTPAQVIEKLRFIQDEGRLDELMVWTAWGGIANQDALRSMRLFAEEVIPSLQPTLTTG